jgi:stearoyl-CoA desaturase (delta-9 desaturase)
MPKYSNVSHWRKVLRAVSPLNTAVILLPHIGALVALFWFSWSGVAWMAGGLVVTGIGITAGYHRLLTHHSYQTTTTIRRMLIFVAALAMDTVGPIEWVGSHRIHHQLSDRQGDPHSPNDGGFWSHIGWAFLKNSPKWRDAALDLARDRYISWIDRWHHVLALTFLIFLYVCGEAAGGLGLSWFLWGGCTRIVLVMHIEWLINSATHRWGYRNFQTADNSTNLWWVAIFALGEGWHNNHHAQPGSAAHGMKWWELDLTWYFIRALESCGFAWKVVRPKAGAGGTAGVSSNYEDTWSGNSETRLK